MVYKDYVNIYYLMTKYNINFTVHQLSVFRI